MQDHTVRFRNSLHIAIDSVHGVNMGMVQDQRPLAQFLRDAAHNKWQPKELALEAACRLLNWEERTQVQLNFVICTAIVMFLDKSFGQPFPSAGREYLRRIEDLVNVLREGSARSEMQRWLEAWYG